LTREVIAKGQLRRIYFFQERSGKTAIPAASSRGGVAIKLRETTDKSNNVFAKTVFDYIFICFTLHTQVQMRIEGPSAHFKI
jgi:hypothetical protein